MATIQQERYYNNIICNGGNKTKMECALEAGYSLNTARKPLEAIESKPAFQALLNEKLPDSKIISKHEALLDCGDKNIEVKVLDMAYKLKGAYAADKHINLNLDHKTLLEDLENDRSNPQG